jgi:RimJ/RimL family protein N-acetyltransferase
MAGINSVPTLKSCRLVLRALRADDHPHLLALARDPDVTRYMHEGPPPSAAEVWQRMATALGQWSLRGYGMMAVDDASGFVGRIGFYHPYDLAEPLLVYAFARRNWGNGYATESVALIRDWMFTRHSLPRILSRIDPNNAASARVASKLGAVRIGTAGQADAVLDLWAYSRSTSKPANSQCGDFSTG